MEAFAYAGGWRSEGRPSLLRRMERRSLLWRVQHWDGPAALAPLTASPTTELPPLSATIRDFMAQRSLWQPRDTADLLMLTLAAATGLSLDILWLHLTQS